MNITPPQIPETLTTVDGFAAYAQPLIADDITISGIRADKEQYEGADFGRLEIRESAFAYCSFHKCCFERASFVDVAFHGCDFSNSDFQRAYFQRCKFLSCKGVGADMPDAVFRDVLFEDTNLQYANFNAVKLTNVLLRRVDFTDASMAEAKLQKFAAEDSRFIRNDFNKTMLKGIDFSGSVLIAPVVSSPPVELRGMIIDMMQAPDMVSLLGIKVKAP